MFEWNIEKAILNFDKHGVSFEEAATAFDDEYGLDWADLKHSKLKFGGNVWPNRLWRDFF